jgi:hypothetical protein
LLEVCAPLSLAQKRKSLLPFSGSSYEIASFAAPPDATEARRLKIRSVDSLYAYTRSSDHLTAPDDAHRGVND